MASTSAIGPVATATMAKLRAYAPLTAAIPAVRILDDVPALTQMPYISVESYGERPFNTMGGTNDMPKFGSVAGLRIRLVSQHRGLTKSSDALSAVKACLDGESLLVDGYASVDVQFSSATPLTDTVNGVTTREIVADFDVTVHQS